VAVVSNSSPLIALATIERLPLFPALFESVVIPPAVAFETRRIFPIRPAWLVVQAPTRPLPAVVLRPKLGAGEREAIALALELDSRQIILDDLVARKVAREAGLSVIGGLGVLLAAKRQGLLALVRPDLEKLLRTSFFLSPALVQELLRDAGEADP
jgi:uncharacterized protein